MLHVFNKSLLLGTFPVRWKTSHITPIFKTGNRQKVENYRGIAILPTLGKLFESLVCKAINLTINRVIAPNQHGFMKGRSSATNLLQFTSNAIAVMESGSQLDVIYTDFSKAFDKVRLRFLIAKLSELGFHSSLLCWLRSYLLDRCQYVNIKGWKSFTFPVLSGVPQGSHLGPILFNLFVNDVVNVFNYVDCLLYADDLKLFGQVSSLRDVDLVQADVNRLSAWCVENSLTLNISKCVCVTFYRIKKPINSSYSINGLHLIKVKGIKDLGVFFDHELNFVKHIEIITSKAYSMLGFVMRICNEFSCHRVYRSLYFAFVRSHLEYCSSVWAPYYVNHSERIESIQKKFLRFLFLRLGYLHYIELAPYNFKRSLVGLHSLADRRRYALAVFVFDLLSGRIDSAALPARIKLNVPSRSLRHSDIVHIDFHRTNYGKFEPINYMCRTFNEFSVLFDFHMSRDCFRASLARFDADLW